MKYDLEQLYKHITREQMNEEELRKQIQEEFHNTLKIINENRLNDLRYAIEHGHYPKIKYFPEDFYFSNKINDDDIKKIFYWDDNDKCYYKINEEWRGCCYD